MPENDENLETTVEESSEEETSLSTIVDNGSEIKLPEKIATVNIGKPHVKFTVDKRKFPKSLHYTGNLK